LCNFRVLTSGLAENLKNVQKKCPCSSITIDVTTGAQFLYSNFYSLYLKIPFFSSTNLSWNISSSTCLHGTLHILETLDDSITRKVVCL